MTVFVVQEPLRRVTDQDTVKGGRYRHASVGSLVPLFDITPAMKYGPVQVLLDHHSIGIAYQRVVQELREKLASFGDEDYILTTGDPAAIGIAIAIAAEVNSGRVKILRWDKIQREYLEVHVDLHRR